VGKERQKMGISYREDGWRMILTSERMRNLKGGESQGKRLSTEGGVIKIFTGPYGRKKEFQSPEGAKKSPKA